MAGYRRFISYMYEYTKGRKSKNTGFAKVESRNGICRMQVHLQEIPQEEDSLDIYAFVREGDWLLGIFLGRMPVQGRNADGRISTPSEKIGDQPYDLDQLAGLWVQSGFGRKYITVFDDEKVDVEKFVTELPIDPNMQTQANTEVEAESENRAEETLQEASEIQAEETLQEESEIQAEETLQAESETQTEETLQVESESQVEEASQAGEANQAEKASQTEDTLRVEEEPQSAGEVQTEEVFRVEEEQSQSAGELQVEEEAQASAEAYTEEEPQEAGETKAEEETQASAEAQTEEEPQTPGEARSEEEFQAEEAAPAEEIPTMENKSRPNPKMRAEERQQSVQREPGEGTVHTQEAAACPQPRYGCQRQMQCARQGLEQRWQCLLKRYPHFQPFGDQEIEQCIQITPRDIRLLNQNHWRLGNNSFVMHGFYNYRHLLLGRKKDGGYVLGIPGLYENQERFMASMFGFPVFKDAAQQTRKGRFGYWCREVE